MPAVANPALKRVTVVTPSTRVDVSLPAQASVADVVPQLVALTGLDLDEGDEGGGRDSGSDGGPRAESADASVAGWVLSRLDGEPLDLEQPVGACGIRDGDLLHLGAGRTALPPAVFDDVVAAVASAAGGRASQWTPHLTRRAGMVGALLLGLGALALVLDAGPGWVLPAAVAGSLAAVLLLCAGLTARLAGQPGAGAALAGVALAHATAASLVAAGGDRSLWALEAPHLLLGGVGLVVAAVAAQVVVGSHAPAFVAAATLGGLGSLVVAGGLLAGTDPARAAGVGLAALLLLTTYLPSLSLRLARLPFPIVPAEPAEFRRDETPTLEGDVLAETRAADRFLTWLLGGTGAAVTGCALALVVTGQPWPWSLVGTAGVLLLLRSRHLRHTGQRAILLATGAVALLAVGLPLLHAPAPLTQLAIAAGVVGLGAPLLTVALRRPVRSLSPYLGRVLDVAEILAAVAILPLLAAVLGLYGLVLGLGS